MGKEFVGLRLDEETIKAVDNYAKENTDGNRSEAFRQIIERGLESESANKVFEDKLNQVMDEQYERMLKVTSRGTKAALANLFLCSTYLPAISDENIATKKMLQNFFDVNRLNIDDESFEDATWKIDKFLGAFPSDIFDFMFKAGGKLQRMEGTPNYSEAERGLHLYERKDEIGE